MRQIIAVVNKYNMHVVPTWVRLATSAKTPFAQALLEEARVNFGVDKFSDWLLLVFDSDSREVLWATADPSQEEQEEAMQVQCADMPQA